MVDEANRLFDEGLPQNLVLHNCGIELERRLWRQGYRTVAGVDEVGRGPLAGPVVAASVVFPQEFFLPGVDDSKKLSAAKREVLFDQILQNALEVGVGIVGEKIIDRTNILNASLAAMCQAVKKLKNPPEFVLVDGNQKIPHLSIPQTPVVKGDSISLCISAASIVAKVTRDRIMLKYHRKYPEFCFAENKGYSTKAHIQALKTFGPCNIHRKSFKLVGRSQTNQIDLEIG
jgi:ribonuclease HII